MSDPLSDIILLLQPRAVFSKVISGAGEWAVRYREYGHPSFCAVLEGSCVLEVEGEAPFTMEQDDFILLPATPGFTMSSGSGIPPVLIDPAPAGEPMGEMRHGDLEGESQVRLLGGYFLFNAPNAALLVSLLPAVLHVRGEARLTELVRLVRDEARAERVGRDLVLTRLVEVLLIEALRGASGENAPAGLLRGLADPRISRAIHLMHNHPDRTWTVSQLARESALSRSMFFERFTRTVGRPPMEYLLVWRMSMAQRLLRNRELGIAEVARQVGYSSASTFSTAFSRHVGQPPSHYGREASRAEHSRASSERQ